jgi:hypothetical protein
VKQGRKEIMAKYSRSDVLEAMLAAQGIALAPGRGERLAAAVSALDVADPLRERLPFECDPTSYMLALSKTK